MGTEGKMEKQANFSFLNLIYQKIQCVSRVSAADWLANDGVVLKEGT